MQFLHLTDGGDAGDDGDDDDGGWNPLIYFSAVVFGDDDDYEDDGDGAGFVNRDQFGLRFADCAVGVAVGVAVEIAAKIV